MKYLFTDNATQGYRGSGMTYHDFKSLQTPMGWIGVLECTDNLGEELLARNPNDIKEVDKEFYDEILKKKNMSQQGHRTIQVSMDPTKPVHAEYKDKAEDAEFVEIDEIEVMEIEEKPKKSKKK